MSKYIALSALQSHWHAPADSLLLTEGCRQYTDENAPDYISPVNLSHADIAKAYPYSKKLADALVPPIAEALERHYNITLPRATWQKLLYPWSWLYIQILYYGYTYIQAAQAAEPSAVFLTDGRESPYVRDWMELNTSAKCDDTFNLHLYSDIVRFLGLDQEAQPLQRRQDETIARWGNACSLKTNIAAQLLLAGAGFTRKPAHTLYGCYGASGSGCIRGGAFRLLQAANYRRTLSLPPLDETFRNAVVRLPFTDDFSQLAGRLALRYLPVSWCEALPELLRWARAIRLPRRGALVTSNAFLTDPLFTALAVTSHKPLAVSEHGGGQLYAYDVVSDCGRAVADRYYGWGDNTDFFLPTPYLQGRKYRKILSPPLLVANDLYRFPSFLSSAYACSVRAYHNRRITFLQHINGEKLPQIRLYFREYGWGVRASLEAALPGLNYQDANAVTMDQAMADTCLVVLDHYMTTFHIVMATGRPTIIFNSPGVYSEQGEKMVQQLRACGIWHDTPESAAAFYMQLVGKAPTWREAEKDILDWWQSTPVRKARAAFCQGYAQTDPHWARIWQEAFDELCA